MWVSECVRDCLCVCARVRVRVSECACVCARPRARVCVRPFVHACEQCACGYAWLRVTVRACVRACVRGERRPRRTEVRWVPRSKRYQGLMAGLSSAQCWLDRQIDRSMDRFERPLQ